MNGLDAILKANDLVAVLGREVAVRLVEISGSGCLLESANRVEKDTAASLRVLFHGVEYIDDVRIMRCMECEGSGTSYYLGAEFLWTTSPGERSLRRVVTLLSGSALRVATLNTSSRM